MAYIHYHYLQNIHYLVYYILMLIMHIHSNMLYLSMAHIYLNYHLASSLLHRCYNLYHYYMLHILLNILYIYHLMNMYLFRMFYSLRNYNRNGNLVTYIRIVYRYCLRGLGLNDFHHHILKMMYIWFDVILNLIQHSSSNFVNLLPYFLNLPKMLYMNYHVL